jgi:anti-anti-sigma regulatory factor
MTCRIERIVGPDGIVVLQLSGRIDDPDVEILRELMESETASKSAVALDLKNVTLVSRDAINLLATVEEKGTELRNCPAYIRDWISREKHSGSMET